MEWRGFEGSRERLAVCVWQGVGFGFWSSVVSSRVRDTRGFGFRFAGVVFAALVLLASCALLCVALRCFAFVLCVPGRDELIVSTAPDKT